MTPLDTALLAGAEAVMAATGGRGAWPLTSSWEGVAPPEVERAWLRCAPPLTTGENIRAALSYVLRGRALGFVQHREAQAMLYAAQTALATLRTERPLSSGRRLQRQLSITRKEPPNGNKTPKRH